MSPLPTLHIVGQSPHDDKSVNVGRLGRRDTGVVQLLIRSRRCLKRRAIEQLLLVDAQVTDEGGGKRNTKLAVGRDRPRDTDSDIPTMMQASPSTFPSGSNIHREPLSCHFYRRC